MRAEHRAPSIPTRLGYAVHRCFMQKVSADDAVRWNIRVSPDTDAALRHFLGERKMKSGELAKFIEEAVRARVFQLTVHDIQSRNAHTDADELQGLIDTAVEEVRKSGRSRSS